MTPNVDEHVLSLLPLDPHTDKILVDRLDDTNQPRDSTQTKQLNICCQMLEILFVDPALVFSPT
jgi:hypothetical protein